MAVVELEDYHELDKLYRIRQDVDGLLQSERKLIQNYLESKSGFIKRNIRISSLQKFDDNHATCTAFCLYYLVGAGLVTAPDSRSKVAALEESQAKDALNALGQALVKNHKSAVSSPPSTDTAGLPNQYNSAIQLAGYLRGCHLFQVAIPTDVRDVCTSIVKYLVDMIQKHGGYVPRIQGEDNPVIPSAYLSYWTGAALQEWVRVTGKLDAAEAVDCLGKLSTWSQGQLANGIAYHHANLISQLDVIEVCYAALASVQFTDSPEARELAHHAMSLLFAKYFGEGCFVPSSSVLADRNNFSLQVPTVEALSLLLLARREIFLDYWEPLCSTFDWLSLHRLQNLGWPPESEGHYGDPTAFMTTSALTFLAMLSSLLDDVLCQAASNLLGVAPISPNPDEKDFKYPEYVGRVIKTNILTPLQSGQNLDLASYSMILYGPPGTAKTTIAKQLARDLEWPILTLYPSDFLSEGMDHMDTEADRIFRLASYLRNVVILFDEVEELVLERESTDKLSRLLTTSMLPRIHRLRDLERVVFIFATNHLKAIDKAASRLGRFDIIRCVMPPTEEEHKTILEDLMNKAGLDKSSKECFYSTRVIENTDNFGYWDLKALVRTVLTKVRIDGLPLTEELVTKAYKAGERNINQKEIEEFKTQMEKVDRP